MITAASSGSSNPCAIEILRGHPDPVHVIITVAVALLDRWAGVIRAFSLRFRGGKRGEGSDQHAGERLRLILAAVRANRRSHIRQTHTADRVAVSITLRHLYHGTGKLGRGAQRERLLAGWLQLHQHAVGRLSIQAHPSVEA